MTTDTRKISIRLDGPLYGKLRDLADIHPHRSMTAVIDKMIVAGMSDRSTAKAHAYLEAAIANLAVIFDLLRRDSHVDPEAVRLARHFYGLLLELTIEIDGVEA